MPSVLVSRGRVTNDYRLGGLKQHKLIVLKFWRPEVHNQSVSRTGSSGGSDGESLAWLFLSTLLVLQAILGVPGLVEASLQSLPLFSCGLPTVCVCLKSPSVFLLEGHQPLDLGPTLNSR